MGAELAPAVGAIPVITALVQIFKDSVPLPNRYMSGVTLLMGIGVVLLESLANGTVGGSTLAVGVMTGLAATGTYEFASKVLANKPPEPPVTQADLQAIYDTLSSKLIVAGNAAPRANLLSPLDPANDLG